MLLTIDIGNTTTEWGLFSDGNPENYTLLESFRLATQKDSSSDEFILKLDSSLQMVGVQRSQIQHIICSSVVPPLDHVVSKMGEKYFKCKPHFVRSQDVMDIHIRYPHPEEIGADRLVNANAAYYFYGIPAIIVDFGTATTICVVTEKGEYIAGMIVPGVKSSLESLISKASKLPPIELNIPDKLIGTSTIESMQIGLFQYTVEAITGIINKIKKEYDWEQVQVIATGGVAKYVASGTPSIDVVDPILILKGLKRWYELNARE
jgi:type III pantothenate kinase